MEKIVWAMTPKQKKMAARKWGISAHTICRGKSCGCQCEGCLFLKRQNVKRDRRFKNNKH